MRERRSTGPTTTGCSCGSPTSRPTGLTTPWRVSAACLGRQCPERGTSYPLVLSTTCAISRLLASSLGVVSNADGSVEATLRRCGVPIDVVIDSTVVGFAKPQPEIFALALERLGITAGDAVHVGDMASADVDGAHAAGVRPLHLDPFGDCPYPVGHHEHVRSLGDVVELVAVAAPL